MKYKVVLTPEQEGGFSVAVPALPGCYTQGETIEEAISMAKDAIELYVSVLRDAGEAVPEGDAEADAVIVLAVDVPAA